MATTMFRKFFVKMGFIRYMLMSNLLLLMMTLPHQDGAALDVEL